MSDTASKIAALQAKRPPILAKRQKNRDLGPALDPVLEEKCNKDLAKINIEVAELKEKLREELAEQEVKEAAEASKEGELLQQVKEMNKMISLLKGQLTTAKKKAVDAVNESKEWKKKYEEAQASLKALS